MHGLLAHSSIHADSTSLVRFLCGFYGRTLVSGAPNGTVHAIKVFLCLYKLGRLSLHDALFDRFSNLVVFKVKSFVDKVASAELFGRHFYALLHFCGKTRVQMAETQKWQVARSFICFDPSKQFEHSRAVKVLPANNQAYSPASYERNCVLDRLCSDEPVVFAHCLAEAFDRFGFIADQNVVRRQMYQPVSGQRETCSHDRSS
jgi:hypothetical protein